MTAQATGLRYNSNTKKTINDKVRPASVASIKLLKKRCREKYFSRETIMPFFIKDNYKCFGNNVNGLMILGIDKLLIIDKIKLY